MADIYFSTMSKTSKTRLVADRLSVVNTRITELSSELDMLSKEKERLDVTLEVLASIGGTGNDDIDDAPAEKNVASNISNVGQQLKQRRTRKAGVTEKIITMLDDSESGMTNNQIVDEMAKHGDVNKASLTATLCRLVKQERLVRIDDFYLIND